MFARKVAEAGLGEEVVGLQPSEGTALEAAEVGLHLWGVSVLLPLVFCVSRVGVLVEIGAASMARGPPLFIIEDGRLTFASLAAGRAPVHAGR